MIPLVFAALLLQQQPQMIQQPREPRTAADSADQRTREAISSVGRRVAEIRSGYDELRRAVFNSPDAVVTERAQALQRACGDLPGGTREATTKICRSCYAPRVQAVVERYRGVLTSVSQAGSRCAAQLTRDLAADATGAAVRRNYRRVGQAVVQGLVPYEARVREVRQAFNIAPQDEPPRRAARRATGTTPR